MSVCLGCNNVGADPPADLIVPCGPEVQQQCIGSLIARLGLVTVTNPDGSITITAPRGITISESLVNGSITQINSRFPTGSLEGYLSSIVGGIGSNISENATYAFGIIVGAIILGYFVLYAILCITLMAVGTIEISTGIVLIFLGLIVAVLVFLIALVEASRFGTGLENSFTINGGEIITATRCAVLSGICCYSSLTCGCPGGSTSLCVNPSVPP